MTRVHDLWKRDDIFKVKLTMDLAKWKQAHEWLQREELPGLFFSLQPKENSKKAVWLFDNQTEAFKFALLWG